MDDTFDFDKFWALVVQVWTEGVYGVDIGKILVAVGIFLFCLLLRRLFTGIVLSRVKAWTEKTETEADDRLVEALQEPVRFIPVVLGAFFAKEFLDLHETAQTIGDNVVRSMVVIAIFWILMGLVSPLSFLLRKIEQMFSTTLVQWVQKALKVALFLVGLATILELWGIEVAPIIAGFGLFGVAVALGAQDMFKNLIAGLTIIAEKRFEIGQWIRVDGVVEGTVSKIGFRSTTVTRFDKAPMQVPNAKLSDNGVTNFSHMSHRRIYWTVGLEYRSSSAQLKTVVEGIRGYLDKTPAFDTTQTCFVVVDSFGPSSIDIMIYCFTHTTNWGEWLDIKQDFAFEIKRLVEEEARTGFAFPSQSVYVEKLPEETPPLAAATQAAAVADVAKA